jgi:hypothetical protein
MREFDNNGLRLAEYQAKLFEASYNRFNCSTSVFLRRFIHSELLERLDKNNSAILSLDVIEGLNDIEEEFGITEYGNNKYNLESLFWVGYIYRYISYTRNVSTIFLFKTFDYKKMFSLYHSFHSQDPEWVVGSLLELYNLEEDYFNPNYRFMQELKKMC